MQVVIEHMREYWQNGSLRPEDQKELARCLIEQVFRVCPTCLTARNCQVWWIMDAPAKIGAGLINLDHGAAVFEIVVEEFAPLHHAL